MAYSINAKDYFKTKLYTGNGSTQSITGVGFQPDLTLIKSRTGGYHHYAFDVIRGVKKWLSPSQTTAETSQDPSLNTFDADGFSLGAWDNINENAYNKVSWNWKAGGAGSANTDGTINSTVSVSTASNFSIVKYTGTGSNGTVGHGLSAKVDFMMIKSITPSAQQWNVYHRSVDANNVQVLNTAALPVNSADYFQDTEPTSSVFTIGNNSNLNTSGTEYIAYCWAEKIGFSKFGMYVGNAQNGTTGSYVYLGFKPSLVIVKNFTNGNTYGWYTYNDKSDPATGTGSAMDKYLYMNTNAAEGTYVLQNFYSNGFQANETGDGNNGSANNYCFMAWAKSPIVGTNNVPATAR